MASPIFTPTCSLSHVSPSDVPLPPIRSVCSPFPLSLRAPLASRFSMIQLPLCTLIFNVVSFFEPLLSAVQEKMHVKTLQRHTHMQCAADEDDAYDRWLRAKQASIKKRKLDSSVKRCPSCDTHFAGHEICGT